MRVLGEDEGTLGGQGRGRNVWMGKEEERETK